MIISFPKLTLRIHDNPLLATAECSVYVIQKERLPHGSSTNKWSYHQFSLLLQTLMVHQRELATYGHSMFVLLLSSKEVSGLISRLEKSHELITDLTLDPAHKLPIKTEISTFTLLDWTQKENKDFLMQFWSKSKTYTKMTKLKSYIIDNVPKPDTLNKPKPTPKIKLTLNHPNVDLQKMLNEIQSKMVSLGMKIHVFPSTEKNLLRYAKNAIRYIAKPSWYKPATSIGTDFGERSKKNDKNTSQLSPFLSIGALSPRVFWREIKISNTGMGSAKDQLLFRECFHTVALAQYFGVRGRVEDFWKSTDDSRFTDNDYKWKSNSVVLKKWQDGVLEGLYDDTNEAMRALFNFGWIHHLRRHLVADVLTRGQLGIHWKHGEDWFRHTLLDHDAVVNRCNWMWLAAVAFSSKQKVFHYNPNTYVARNTYQ